MNNPPTRPTREELDAAFAAFVARCRRIEEATNRAAVERDQ